MSDPSLYSLVSLAIEQTINTALRYDPGTRAQLQAIANKILQINIDDTELALQLHIEKSEVRVVFNKQNAIELKPDVSLSGKTAKLVELAVNHKHSLSDSGVEVSGNLATLETLQTVFSQLDIDWQDALAEYLHPAAANLLSSTILKSVHFARRQAENVANNTEDYLSNEFRLIPHKLEIENFRNDVNNLRMRTDRISAKIAHLHAKATSTSLETKST